MRHIFFNIIKKMKNRIIIIITACCVWSSGNGYAQTGLKGTVNNADLKDSIALFNPFNRQAPPLEKVGLGKKGSFEFSYKPADIGFYFVNLPSGKNILVVVNPKGSGQMEIDASTSTITKVTDSKENTLLKSCQDLFLDYDKKQKSLEATDKSPEQKTLEKQLIEQEQVDALQNLLLKNATNYATTALLEYLPMEHFFPIYDSVLTTLIKIYPENGFVKSKYQSMEPLKRLAIGSPAPEITLPDPSGNMFSLSSLKGKVVLIDFWAAWCRPCRMENPNMVRLYQTYSKYGFDILGVSMDDNKDAWLKAIQTDGLTWNHISDLKKWQSAAGQLYGVGSIPFTVLIDKDGTIIAKGLRGEALEQKLKEVLLK